MKYGEKDIKEVKLELWDNPSPDRDYVVDMSFPEPNKRTCFGIDFHFLGVGYLLYRYNYLHIKTSKESFF